MSVITEEIIIEFKEKLKALVEPMTEDNRNYNVSWMFKEYRNFMLISREDYKDTINIIIENNKKNDDKDGEKLFTFLLNEIEQYGATKIFFYASSFLMDEFGIEKK